MRLLILFFINLIVFEDVLCTTDTISLSQFNAKINLMAFEENNGQVKYPDYKAATEVKYLFRQGNLKIFLLQTGLAYQLEKFEADSNLPPESSQLSGGFFQTYRMDMELVGANPNARIIAESKSDDYTNYYNHNVLNVHSYKKITYKNIYPGIDWVIYVESKNKRPEQKEYLNFGLKYDFIVHPGANPVLIKLKYKNAEQIYLDSFGNLMLRNRLGDIREDAPKVFQNQNEIPSSYILKDSLVSFNINSYDKNQKLIIDPQIEWGTYYGGNETRFIEMNLKDSFLYLAGSTSSSSFISYLGFRDTLQGNQDGILIKFTTSGSRIWATYYGGESGDIFFSLSINDTNIIVAGYTDSKNNIAFNGYLDTLPPGATPIFFTRFNQNGSRVWGSYFASNSGAGSSCYFKCRSINNSIYIADKTNLSAGIAHNGFKNFISIPPIGTPYPDIFIVRFDLNCNRIWGTYFGGIGLENLYGLALDMDENIYISGTCGSLDNMILNAHQTSLAGSQDNFLAKIDSSCSLKWCTYSGGNSLEEYGVCHVAQDGVYLFGLTNSTNNIALNAHFGTKNGGRDSYIAKYNFNGTKLWGTYFGGNLHESAHTNYYNSCPSIGTDRKGFVYSSYITLSTSGINYRAFAPTRGTTNDATLFINKWRSNGELVWSSFWGGNGDYFNINGVSAINGDSKLNLYIAGTTTATSGISYQGFQNNLIGGGRNGFIAKFSCPRKYDTLHHTHCPTDSFFFNKKYIKIQGIYYDTFDTWEGCDSFITLHLTVLRKDTTYLYDTICSGASYVWNGLNRTASGVYRDTLTNNVGCDSFLVLNLHIKRTDTIHLYDTSCANLPKTFNSQNLTMAGIYRDTLKNIAGCDSHIFYHFIPKPIYETPLSRSICAGDSTLFGGKYRKLAGTYYDTLKTKPGCDSVIKMTLTLNPLDTNRQSQTICRGKSYLFFSQTLTTAGTYFHTLKNKNNCDSTIILTLSVIDSSTYSFSRMLCSGQSFNFNNQILTQAGVYRDTFSNYLGCDSFVTLNLSFGLVLYDTLRQTVCAGQSFRGYLSPGTYYETYISNQGCDSILTINLKHLPASEYKIIQHSKCGAFRYGSSTYAQNDSFTETIKNSLNCDSIVTKHIVTITKPNPLVLEPKSIPFCEEILHRSQAKTQSFYTQDTVKSAEYPYCDSLYQPIFYQREIRPDLAIYAASDTVVRGQTIQLSAALANNYRWNTGEQTTVIRPKIEESTTFTVHGWNLENCEGQASIAITAVEPLIIDFPTAFSPNGDGLNDSFYPNTNQNVIIESFDIYNRIGEKFYSYTPLSPSWNGFYLGQPAAAGVYSYILNYRFLGNRFTKTGEVMVVR